MPKKRDTPEEGIQHLWTVELEPGKGLAGLDAWRKVGITEQPSYRGKKEDGGLRVNHAQRRKGLEPENLRLKRMGADQALDLSILKEVAAGNFYARREAVEPAVRVLQVSARRACRAIGPIRSSARSVPRPDPFREPLRQRIIALAKEYGRYGYRTVTDRLRLEGWDVGKDRVYTRWRHEGLNVPTKQPTRARLWRADGSCLRRRPAYGQHVWSYDGVADRTHDGRLFRILNIIDEDVRACLASYVARRIRSQAVILVLADRLLRHGRPAHIRSENGPEFIARHLQTWLKNVLGVAPL